LLFCDGSNQRVTPGQVFPSQVVQFCVEADSAAADVVNLHEVIHSNTLETGFTIPLITDLSASTNHQTNMVCRGGICNVKTVAFAHLYEKRYPDGTVEDIAAGVKVSGTAVLDFVTVLEAWHSLPLTRLKDDDVGGKRDIIC
jgi:hypothetical protein